MTDDRGLASEIFNTFSAALEAADLYLRDIEPYKGDMVRCVDEIMSERGVAPGSREDFMRMVGMLVGFAGGVRISEHNNRTITRYFEERR